MILLIFGGINKHIYIRDGFDFSGDNQPLGEWDNNIFSPKKPSISATSYKLDDWDIISNLNYLSNDKLNEFRNKYAIGKDFKLFLKPILIDNLFNKIIINKETNEITYKK
jgi:hypothetical protein